MKIKQYESSHHNACIEIFKSNTPLYFGEDEIQGLERWLESKDKGEFAYKNNEAEHFYVVENDAAEIVGCGGFLYCAACPGCEYGLGHGT